MAPAHNTRSGKINSGVRTPSGTKWQCDFCHTAKFDTYDEALEHEGDCDEKIVTIRLSYEQGKRLGLILSDELLHEEGKGVSISEKSPVFRLLPARNVANALFNLDGSHWAQYDDGVSDDHGLEDDSGEVGGCNDSENEDDDDDAAQPRDGDDSDDSADDIDEDLDSEDGDGDGDALDVLIDFGQKNMHHMLKIGDPRGCTFFNLNVDSLKAVLSGRIQSGSIIQKVTYTKEQYLDLRNQPKDDRRTLCCGRSHGCGSIRLAKLLREREHYPVELTLQRIPSKQYKTNVPKIPLTQREIHRNALTGIQKLDLSENDLVNEDHWRELFHGLSQIHLLQGLNLDKNDIGRNGCAALAALLKKENSALKSLSLRENAIDDECVFMFAEAIKNNTALVTLNLGKNDDITALGWKSMLNLLCDKTSIESTYLSNHSLESLGVDFYKLGHSSSSSPELSRVSFNIRDMLRYNSFSLTKTCPAVRKKIWRTHFNSNGDSFDIQPLLNIHVKIMPQLLAWFTKKGELSTGLRLNKVFHIVLNWNTAELFGFPSAEKMRIGSLVTELETKNADLVALVAKIKMENRNLRRENDTIIDVNRELREENQVLKGKNGTLGCVPVRYSKRTRRS